MNETEPEFEKNEEPSPQRQFKGGGKEKFILGIILGSIVTSLIVVVAFDYTTFYTNIWSLLIVALILFCSITFTVVLFKEKIFKKILKVTFPTFEEISSTAGDLFENVALGKTDHSVQNGKKLTELLINYHIWIKLRNWTIGTNIALLAVLAGFFATILTLAQNTLISEQNEIEKKTLIVNNATRYNQFGKVRNLVYDINKIKSSGDKLSYELLSEIGATTKVLSTYSYLDKEGRYVSNLSEEKGVLLQGLINSNLSAMELEEIFKMSDFSFTDLSYFNSSEAIVLKGLVLNNSRIFKCNLDKITFDSVDMKSIVIENSVFNEVVIDRSNLSGGEVDSSMFLQCEIINIVTDYGFEVMNSKVDSCIFDAVSMDKWKFKGAFLTGNHYRQTSAKGVVIQNSKFGSKFHSLIDSLQRTMFKIRYVDDMYVIDAKDENERDK